MKNITISVEDELWLNVKHAADEEHVSMNAFIKQLLASQVGRHRDSPADRLLELAKGHRAPEPWKWNREEIYEDAI